MSNDTPSVEKATADTACSPWLGIIADDVTGATDVAGYLVRGGTPTLLFFGTPNAATVIPADTECLVIALTTRSAEPDDAVAQSLAAAKWLRGRGATQVYFKYCSTFDSTARGNIGPVADALAALLSEPTTIVCPSTPENGRTVYQGHLFVGDQTLSESPMRDHPVNPMRNSDLRQVLGQQSSFEINLIPHSVVREGSISIVSALTSLGIATPHHVVIDATINSDLDEIARVALGHVFSSGAAGLAAAMGRLRNGGIRREFAALQIPSGGSVILSGSCSAATQEQVQRFIVGRPSFEIDPLQVDAGGEIISKAIEFLRNSLPNEVPIFYSTAAPSQVRHTQLLLGVERAASLVEVVLSQIAMEALACGARKFIVTGGETSGAIVTALGVTGIRIGHEVATGVPLSVTSGGDPIALILKSGNFGGPNFFSDALGHLDGR